MSLPAASKSHCSRKPCGCSTLLSTSEKGREGGKAIAEKAEAALANRWRRLVELAALFINIFVHNSDALSSYDPFLVADRGHFRDLTHE